MKKTIGLMAITLLTSCSLFQGDETPKIMTKQKLLESCEVPEKREMPLSKEIAPCDDFYSYVCSEVRDNFELPADRSRWTFSFTDNAERILCAKKKYFELLEEGYTTNSKRLAPAKALYLSCMDKSANINEERDLLRREMDRLDQIKDKATLLDLFGSRIDKPIGGVVGFFAPANQDNALKYDINFFPRLSYLRERSYSENPELMKEFKALVTKFFEVAEVENPAEKAKWVVQFEKDIQQALPLPKERRKRFSQRRYKKRSYFKKYDKLHLDEIFAKIPASMKARDAVPEGLTFMNEWLTKASLEEIKNVYAFYTFNHWLDDGYPEFFKMTFDFDHKYLGGPAQRPPRQERCTNLVKWQYRMELDEELISILFPNFDKQKVVNLAEKVRSSLLDGIQKNTWLTKSAKSEAKKKIKTAKLQLVHPDTEEDWNFLPILNLDPKTPRVNLFKISAARMAERYKDFLKDRSRTKWFMGPLTANAYYSSSDNKFVLLQGILQYPFYDQSNLEIENIGSIGAVVGHELGHGIDDQGSKYDASGRLRQWMTKKDLKEFKKRGGRFVKRFEKAGHDGELTLGENIGDHVGITSAFHAAFPNEKIASKENMKKFFEAYARSWCQKMRPKYREAQLKTDPHALGLARVNEQVIHVNSFYDAYQCTSKDKMYIPPKERIRVW